MSIKKLIICPYFGDMPPWMDEFIDNYEATLKPNGYDLLIDTDLEGFKERVRKNLLIEYPGLPGTGKVWDYRCTLGYLYWNELADYDYWGHMDFDVVFGDVNAFLPDSKLETLDVYSTHHEYVCGCFSMYKNSLPVKCLFMRQPNWGEFLNKPEPNGWVETDFSRLLERSGLKYAYEFPQGNPWTIEPILTLKNNKLYQYIGTEWREIMLFHFRHSKKWPL